MSSHHRSGGPPSLMDDMHDFDRNIHSQRFEGGRGRGDGMRGNRGGRGFGPRGGPRGGRGDFHQRDRFNDNNNHFNRQQDDQRAVPTKMPSLFDVDPQQSRSFDFDNNRGGGRGRMAFPRGGRGGGHEQSNDDRYHFTGPKSDSSTTPPSLFSLSQAISPNEKQTQPTNTGNGSLPSLLSVQVDANLIPTKDSGVSPSVSESNKSQDTLKDNSHARSDSSHQHSSSHRPANSDNENRYRDRDSRSRGRGDFHRSSSFNRDRSRSPRDRDHHGPPRDNNSFGGEHRRGGRGGPGDHFGRGGRGGYQNNSREPHQSRFTPDNRPQQHQQPPPPPPWQDRREGGRGGFQGHQHEPDNYQRQFEQPQQDNHPFNRDRKSNFETSPSSNRHYHESYQEPGNFGQGSAHNRPDFYPPNNNMNPTYQQHPARTGGRPSRFSDRQDEFDDVDRPLTKPDFSLPVVTTTTPLYINQPTNPTFTQARSSMPSSYSSQQPPSGMFPPGAPTHNQPQPPFGWPNQQQSQGPSSANVTQSLLSIASNGQQNNNMPPPPPPSNSFYGGADYSRQQPPTNSYPQQPPPPPSSQYYAGVPPQGPKPSGSNVHPASGSMPPQQQTSSTATSATANASNVEAWQQYYQQYWQYMQQQQQQTGVQPPSGVQQQYPQTQTATAPKPSQSTSATSTTQDPTIVQANADAWTQYWIQYQAYMQQQQQMSQQQQQVPVPTSTNSSTSSTTISAPSQLYPQQGTVKQQAGSSSNARVGSGAPPPPASSNWQTWFNLK